MRRILHVTAGLVYGGIETFLSTLARHRHLATPVETQFAVCFEGRLAQELRAAGAGVAILGPVRARAPWTVLAARRRLGAILERGDVLVCHGAWSQGLFGDLGRRACGTVFHMHGPAAGGHWTEWLARRNRPDGVVSNSAYTASTLDRLYPGVRVEVCAIPVELHRPHVRRSEVRDELGAARDAVVVVLASRLEAWKGHEQLLRALSRLRTTSPWEAWIIGGPQSASEERYLMSLKALAREGGVADRVRFVGQRADVGRLFAASDIHCQPNVEPEPFGVAFIEALAVGLPVITANFGGGAEIVTSECGVLVQPSAVDELAAALTRLIDDRAERERLGAAGPARAAALCAPERQVPRLVASIESLIGSSTTVARR